MIPSRCTLFVFSLLILPHVFAEDGFTGEGRAGNWNQFRGPGGTGIVADGILPTTWNDASYQWQVDLGSRDVSSPIVQKDSIYLLTSQEDQQQIAIESRSFATGELNWSRSYAQATHPLHSRNTFASSTPTADDQHVYFAFADPQHTWLIAIDHAGHEVWKRDFGPWQSQHGFGTSPRLVGNLVLLLLSQQAQQLAPGQAAGESRLVAVDAKTGKDIWETPLAATRSCYGTPASFGTGDQRQLIGANTGNGMFAVDPVTGKMLWNKNVFDMRCCSTPLVLSDPVHGNLAIATSGSGGGGGNHLVAVKIPSIKTPLADQTLKEVPEQVYRIDRNVPYVPTPLLHDQRLFMIDDRGIATCTHAVSGELIWKQRIGGNFSASPILIGDTILMINMKGKATLIHASAPFEKVNEIDLGGPVSATPAYSQGRLILRVGTQLRSL